MKKYKYTTIALIVAIAGSNIFYGCSKGENNNKEEIITEQIIKKETKGLVEILKKAWAALKAITAIEVEVNYKTGYYNAEYYENGNLKRAWCNPGDATCNLDIKVGSISANLSSEGDGEEYPNKIASYLVIDDQKNVLLALHYNSNPDECKKFFYSDDVIDFTCPYVIDNPRVLKQLYQEEKITIFGKYDVPTIAEGDELVKYISLTKSNN
jgi:hypothetical protein